MPLTFKIFFTYYGLVLLTCSVTGCLLVRRTWPRAYQLLVLLSCVTLAVESLTFYCLVHNINYIAMYNVWDFLETVTMLVILSRELEHSRLKRLPLILLMILPPGAALCFIVAPGYEKLGINEYAALLYLFTELITACAILIHFLRGLPDTTLSNEPGFWLAAGMLFYCSLFIIINSLLNFLTKDPYKYNYFLPFSCAANTFMYGGFIACYLTQRRKDKQKLAIMP